MKTFWDIEKEKTWRIYFLFALLLIFYFVPIFLIWICIKVIIHTRQTVFYPGLEFQVFGIDTLLVLLIAGVATYLHWYYSNKHVVQRVLHLLGAKQPDKNDTYHYVFMNIVDEMETSSGGMKVERFVVPTGAMNAFSLADMHGRCVVGVTEGLLSRLMREELQGVIAHEVAHIVANDSLQTTTICSLFGIYSEALARMGGNLARERPRPSLFEEEERQVNIAATGALGVPILMLLFITTLLGEMLNMFISREKEYRADANAVKYTRNPLGLARALYKIGVHWRGAGYGGEYFAPIFILRPMFRQLDERETLPATLFSTHPPLIRRLQVLLDMAHSDLDHIAQELARSRPIKSEPDSVRPEVRFMVQHEDNWEGPFTAIQMQTLDWIRPDTALRIQDSEEYLRAGDLPVLNLFFQKRNEPIWKIKRLCPDCRQWLVLQEYEGLYLWRCGFCDGLLVERDKLPRIFVRKEKGFNSRIMRLARLMQKDAEQKHPHFTVLLDISRTRRCPKCGNSMTHRFYSYAYHVEIDTCQKCQLFWFDVEELEILQCLIEMGELPNSILRNA